MIGIMIASHMMVTFFTDNTPDLHQMRPIPMFVTRDWNVKSEMGTQSSKAKVNPRVLKPPTADIISDFNTGFYTLLPN